MLVLHEPIIIFNIFINCFDFTDESLRILSVSCSGRYIGVVSNRRRFRLYDCQKPDVENDKIETDDAVPEVRNLWKFVEGKSSSVILAMTIVEVSKFPHLLLSYADGSIVVFDLTTWKYSTIISKDENSVSLSSCSVHDKLAVFHNWEIGFILHLDGRQWQLKKKINFPKVLQM